MKRKLVLLLIVLLQSIILLGSKQDRETQLVNKVTDIFKKFPISYEGIFKQDIEEVLPDNEVEVKEEIIYSENQPEEVIVQEEQIEAPRNDPVLIPITQRQANDAYPDSGEAIATIRIPSLNLYQTINYGDEQSNIDTYDICVRTYHRFDQNGAVILAGHNYKSFANLKNITTGNEIFIHSYYGDFTFIVDGVRTGTTDGENVYDAEGNLLIDFYDCTNKLYLYTCDDNEPQKRVVVSAHMGGV